jgi:phage terminase large subunit GpA-like protein
MIATTTTISDCCRLGEIAAVSFSPVSGSDPVTIVESNFALSPDVEASSGFIDLDEMPWWRRPLQLLADPTCSDMSVMGSTQLGKTVTLMCLLILVYLYDPSPSMVVLPTEPDAKFFRDRFYRNCEESADHVAEAVPPSRLRNMQAIELRGMRAYLAWSGSSQRLRSKPAKYVFQTEIDVYDYSGEHGDPTQTSARRTDQFYGSTIYRESTPVGENSKIHEYHEAGSKEKWHVTCPHCGKEQPLNFYLNRDSKGGIGGLYTETGDLKTRDQVEQDAYYVCLDGCKIDNSFKRSMLLGGRWVATYPERSAKSLHLWQIFNHKKTFGNIAAEYVKAVEEGTIREFTQDVLGKRYVAKNKLPMWSSIANRLAYTHNRGTVPDDVWFLTAASDVQEDRVYWLVAGWGPNRTCTIIDWGCWLRYNPMGDEEFDDLAQVPTLLDFAYSVNGTSPMGLTTLSPRLVGCDANYRKNQVIDMIYEEENPRLIPVRGDHTLKSDRRWRTSPADRDPETNKPLETGRIIYGIYTHFYQEQINDRLTDANDFSLRLPADILPSGEPLCKQLVNVKRTENSWKAISPKVGEDWRDCLVYASCEADMIVVKTTGNWSEQAFEEWNKNRVAKATRSTSPTRKEAESILDR